MSISNLLKIYHHLPVFTQNVVFSLYGLSLRSQRYNKTFREAFSFLKSSEWWDKNKINNYQNRQLYNIIDYSFNNVPYYNELFRKHNISPSENLIRDQLQKIPLLNKSIIKNNYKELRSVNIPDNSVSYGYTGGTTGSPLKLTYDKITIPWQWAVWWRHRNRFGVNINDPFIVFGGKDAVPSNTKKAPFWRRNISMHQTYVSIHRLTRNDLPILAEYLFKRKVVYYSGHPSSLYTVASFFIENKIKLPHPPRKVFTGAETLLPHQKRAIESAFDTKISDQYGAAEYCFNISECENFKYHIDFEFGFIELLPIKGMPDNIRKVVATGFKNYAMPLIRYDIGDLVTLSNETCTCGRESPIIEKIDGRMDSYILTPDGKRLGRLGFLFYHCKNIKEAQIVQNELSTVIFRIVKNHNYNEQDEKQLIETIQDYMGTSFKIKLEYLSSIPREKNGKFRQIVSTIFRDKLLENCELQ